MDQPLPWTVAEGGLYLALRLTPRASADRIDGISVDSDGRPLLLLRLKAPPVEGAANAALIAYLAKTLKVRKADVAIVAGETGRMKRLRISGDAEATAARLAALVSP